MRVLPCGDRAVLIDCDSLEEAQAWFAALQPECDVVLGARTVLAHGHPPHLTSLIRTTQPAPAERPAARDPISIPVIYDGADLSEVAELTGLTAADVVSAHSGRPWRVAFGGFAPGFFYLVGGDPRLEVPRRPTPRTRVPTGAVGLAGGFSGVYPRESPGGWHIIGRTATALWDVDRTPPALLTTGQSVRFVVA